MGNRIQRVAVTILIILVCAMVMSSIAKGDIWDVNAITLNERIGIISNVMGKHTMKMIEDACATFDGRTLDAYGITVVELSWQRNNYEVVTTVTVPIPRDIIRKNFTLYNAIFTTTAYNASSTFTMRKLQTKEVPTVKSIRNVWTRSIGTWQ